MDSVTEGSAGAGSAADLLGTAAATAGAGDGGAGDGGAGAGDGGAGAGDGGDAGTGGIDPDWYGNLSAEADGETASNRDWIKAKGFKDLDGVTKALRFAEKAIHDSGRVKIPGEGATPEEVAAYHKAIGVPEDPKGYEFKAPEGPNGEPLPLNGPLLERLASAGQKLGVPKGALESLAAEIMQGELDERHQFDSEQQAAAQKWVKDQGAEGTVKLAAIDRAMGALGLTREDGIGLRNVLGADKALGLLARLGAGMAEGGLLDAGGRERFAVSGRQAQAELNQLKADPQFVSKAMVPGTVENVRYNRLLEAIGAEADRLSAA